MLVIDPNMQSMTDDERRTNRRMWCLARSLEFVSHLVHHAPESASKMDVLRVAEEMSEFIEHGAVATHKGSAVTH